MSWTVVNLCFSKMTLIHIQRVWSVKLTAFNQNINTNWLLWLSFVHVHDAIFILYTQNRQMWNEFYLISIGRNQIRCKRCSKIKMSNPIEPTESKSFFYTILPILLCGLSIPLSLFLWIGNLALTFITKSSHDSEGESEIKANELEWWRPWHHYILIIFVFFLFSVENAAIPPTRWLFSTLVPVLLMAYGLKRKGVDRSGATLGLIIAFILSLANHAFLACLATFFFSSSRVTKFRGHLKRKFEVDFRGGDFFFFFE